MSNLPLHDLNYPDEIRELIGIDSTVISDDSINRDTVKGQAEREIKIYIPTWATLTGDDVNLLRSAVIYRICSMLCDRLALLQPNREVIGDYEYTLAQLDWTAMSDKFNVMMASALQLISTYVIDYKIPDILATPSHDETIPTWGYI